MDRPRLKVTHLPIYDQSNGWHQILPPLAEPTTLTGDVACDHLVIGGGYSGLAVARRLAELDPSAAIVLIDGDRIGNNAAGRSSGFAIDHAHNLRAKSFADAKKAAQDAIALNRAGLGWLDETIVREHVDCQWVKEGKYHAAATSRGERMLGQFAESLKAIEEDHSLLDTDDCADLFGTSFYTRAIHAPHSYLVQPAALVRGLAATMPENVTVYEQSMVIDVEYGTPHVIRTARGSASAPNLILATNGFTEGFGFLQKRLIPLITWGSITRELTADESDQIRGAPSYGIIAAHRPARRCGGSPIPPAASSFETSSASQDVPTSWGASSGRPRPTGSHSTTAGPHSRVCHSSTVGVERSACRATERLCSANFAPTSTAPWCTTVWASLEEPSAANSCGANSGRGL